jgi:hypothetical protein
VRMCVIAIDECAFDIEQDGLRRAVHADNG